jgi:hypothetical protein
VWLRGREIFKTTPEGAVRNKTILPLTLFVLLLLFCLSLLIDFLARLSGITNLTTFGFTLNSVCWSVHVLVCTRVAYDSAARTV